MRACVCADSAASEIFDFVDAWPRGPRFRFSLKPSFFCCFGLKFTFSVQFQFCGGIGARFPRGRMGDTPCARFVLVFSR